MPAVHHAQFVREARRHFAFLSMMTSPEYQLANVDRENGVEDHVILVADESYSKFTT